MLQPVGLTQTIKPVLLAGEGRTSSTPEVPRAASRTAAAPPPRLTSSGPRLQNTITPTRSVTGVVKQPVRRMTDAKYADKRAKGLCFRCDGKFTPRHRCPERSLQVLMVSLDAEDVTDLIPEEPAEHVHLDAVEVSAHSLHGLSTPRTMKIWGSIHGTVVVTLVDSGATHNFISRKLVARLNLPVTGSQATGVVLGNGTAESSVGICLDVPLQLPGLTITDDFFPLELGSTDVILGIKWLRQLGDTRVNWNTLTMSFDHHGSRVTLRGEPSLQKSAASLRSLAWGLSTTFEGFWVELASLDPSSTPTSQVHPALDELLLEFAGIFDMPIGLPPSRGHEHAITLKEGTEPINVRPYRYPQLQKDEIERLVAEMIAAGVIRPSHSPFSSLVLLVKKKDGSWRFCVDYRALNKATVLDKFPIPVTTSS